MQILGKAYKNSLSYKQFLAYFNKLYGEAYKKKTQNSLYGMLKLVTFDTKISFIPHRELGWPRALPH